MRFTVYSTHTLAITFVGAAPKRYIILHPSFFSMHKKHETSHWRLAGNTSMSSFSALFNQWKWVSNSVVLRRLCSLQRWMWYVEESVINFVTTCCVYFVTRFFLYTTPSCTRNYWWLVLWTSCPSCFTRKRIQWCKFVFKMADSYYQVRTNYI